MHARRASSTRTQVLVLLFATSICFPVFASWIFSSRNSWFALVVFQALPVTTIFWFFMFVRRVPSTDSDICFCCSSCVYSMFVVLQVLSVIYYGDLVFASWIFALHISRFMLVALRVLSARSALLLFRVFDFSPTPTAVLCLRFMCYIGGL